MKIWLPSTCLIIRFFVSILLAQYDLRYRLLPNRWTAILFLCNLDLFYLHHQTKTLLPWFGTQALLYLCVVLPLFLISWHGYRHQVMLLGMGDIKLIAALTPWLTNHLPWVLLLASLSAVSVLLLSRKRLLPFGPFLLVAAWFVHAFSAVNA